MKSTIPDKLKKLVSDSVKLLGFAIQDIYGTDLYQEIESLRLKMKDVRFKNHKEVESALEDVYFKYKKFPDETLHNIARAFSLMLELINSCEAAYRTHRLEGHNLSLKKTPHSLIFVFTSHPTEARSANFLHLLNKIEYLLSQSLVNSFEENKDQLYHLFRIALRLNLANNQKPQVKDEAQEIFHFVLNPLILREQVELKKMGVHVLFRTWVGGDKDGHPHVGPQTMLQSFNLSRKRIIEYIYSELVSYESEIKLIESELVYPLQELLTDLKNLKTVNLGDGGKVLKFKNKFDKFVRQTEKHKLDSSTLGNIIELMWLYPALVLPLEVREDHELIHAAINNSDETIARMLKCLKEISFGYNSKWYVRGFVISMCETSQDIEAAIKLTKKILGSLKIPIVPLFENAKGLSEATKILDDVFKKQEIVSHHQKTFGGKFEIMLGYSDSSKENGVLPARLLVEKALFAIEKCLLKNNLIPVFFHGSGGSVSRGGGSIKEQVAWWPESALNIFKVTIQGEMVQRNFHHPLIMRSQVGKIVEEFASYKQKEIQPCSELLKFSNEIQRRYQELVKSDDFQELVLKATPYEFLNLLKIGSRPAKRTGSGQFTIRAIPWILCWTQTRLLLPIWWGVGSAWSVLSDSEKNKIKRNYEQSDLLQSYVKNLGFTLAKVELGVWNFHLSHSTLSADQQEYWREHIEDELSKVDIFFNQLTNNKPYTWYRPMLGESIKFRSSMIHPLNLIQKISLERQDHILLRETVTGVACGMLTTG